MNYKTIFYRILLLFLFVYSSFAIASPATEATSALKGYFGESLVEDIYKSAGRELIPYKIDPNIHGPDKIFKLANGVIEVHEVKAYSNWAGSAAMKTTAEGVETYELSARWCQNWIDTTLASPSATDAEKQAARALSEAIKNNKVRYIYDEVNLLTEEFRSSEVLQVGLDGVKLSENTKPMKIKRFNQFFSKKTKDFMQMKVGNLEKIMDSPKVSAWQPLSKEDQLKLLLKEKHMESNGRKIDVCKGLMTADGRLLVSIKAGASAGLLVFAADAGHSVYRYVRDNSLKPELERNIEDAAIKGAFVGTCVGVTVFLGATPGGWCVLGVSIGSYLIIDTALRAWHESKDAKHLNISDLKGWGIYSDTPLNPTLDSTLSPKIDTPLNPKLDTIFN